MLDDIVESLVVPFLDATLWSALEDGLARAFAQPQKEGSEQMSEWVELIAEDEQLLQAYVARPAGEPKGALVVVQEIFGVNEYVQSVADDWAHDGFLAIAPAMFDRIEPNVKLSYTPEDSAKAMSFVPRIDMAKSVLDLDAAIQWLRSETPCNVGVVGYCYGGTMAWLAATRLKVEAAVGYYGGNIASFVNEEPQCPVMLHFGEDDAHIPASAIAKIQSAHPEVPIFLYPNAGHAFNRMQDHKSYAPEAARQAKSRSLLFFQQHLVF